MRQIKFRVWDSETPAMIPPTDIDIRFIDGDLVVYYWSEQYYEGGGDIHTRSISEEIKSPILMQFTGLKDRNGVEIYEGDILKNTEHGHIFKITWGIENETYAGWAGVWLNSENGFISPLYNSPLLNCEIIGNIYEHPNQLTNE